MIVASGIIYFSYRRSPDNFLSPLIEHLPIIGTSTATNTRIVYGFLPFWNLKYASNFRYQFLTHLAFFSLDVDSQGNIRTRTDDGYTEPGWSAYQDEVFGRITRQARQHGVKIVLTLTAMDQATIEAVIASPKAQARLLNHLHQIIDLKNLDGINIDFEYAGTPTPTVQNRFTQFVKLLSQNLKADYPRLELSLDVFADTALKFRIWDLPRLAPSLDHIIVMAYDFHRPSSPIAGPIAPLRGGCPTCPWNLDVTQTLAALTKAIPASKIILGVPYYGYGWQTTSDQIGATTYPDSGELATFNRIQQILGATDADITQISQVWDEASLSPYLTYKLSGRWHQIWFEDERSLQLKYALVNQTGLAGIAIWALGYDGDHQQLWHLLKSFRLR